MTRDGQEFGPYTEAEMIEYAGRGQILESDLILRQGWPYWVRASNVEVLAGKFAAPSVYPKPDESLLAIANANKQPDTSPQVIVHRHQHVHVHHGNSMVRAGIALICLGIVFSCCTGGWSLVLCGAGVVVLIIGACS